MPTQRFPRTLTVSRGAALPYFLLHQHHDATPAAFPFGQRNAAETIGHLVAQRMHRFPTNDEFVGMTEYVVESFHDLLVGDSESLTD